VETFDEVLMKYEPMIYACVRRLKIYKNHEQFIQIGRIGLWNAWKRYQNDKGDFTPFAYRTIYGSMLDELKQSSLYDQHTIPTESDILQRLTGTVENTASSSHLYEALETLTKQEQLIIQLLFVEGYTLDEVAIHFGISKSGIKKRRERTLEKLRILISNSIK